MSKYYILFYFLLACFVRNTTSVKILVALPHKGRSLMKTFEPYIFKLAERGRNVTVITHHPTHFISDNYHEISIQGSMESASSRLSISRLGSLSLLQTLHGLTGTVTDYERTLKQESIQNLLNSTERFDLLITSAFASRMYLGLVENYNVPVIYLSSNILFPNNAINLGDYINPSFVVSRLGGQSWRMNFMQRVDHFINVVVNIIWFELNDQWFVQPIAGKYFNLNGKSLKEIENRVSLALVNTHFTHFGSRPVPSNVIEVGGINLASKKNLPMNIEKFINESKHGVVYFCMGSLLRGETFPPEKREAFLYAFSKIPQRVLWKWEGDVLPGKSDNIMISKWMPQRDILAHPNVKLFISHGGLLGTSEAVYEGVPVLGIPIFGDQRTNIKSLEANGAGELLDYNEISKEVVLEKIQRLLNDPKYKENAKLLSDRYRDRPMSPLDTAVYWTEYVIRHKGAPHLRTAAADMPWYQYLLLDVIAFIVAVLVAGLLIIYYTTKFILRAIYGLICGGGAKKGSSKSDKKKRN
ncbi:UDP-glycosyltransferase UGT5-like isoform X33 [Planococcus citri]|uniref:UDP-glycosyltransferase UGT5-like isoform X33 n=1 Tax=Planococcus citri TaxID=170843 RepID=UPI0031F85A92